MTTVRNRNALLQAIRRFTPVAAHWGQKSATRRFWILGIGTLLGVTLLSGVALAWNCVNVLHSDPYWGPIYNTPNLHLTCTPVAGRFYQCPNQAVYPVDHTAEVGAIMVLYPAQCGASGLIYDSNNNLIGGGHVGIVVGVGAGSIQVYEEGWAITGPSTHSHSYPCQDHPDGMWFIHRSGSQPPPPPQNCAQTLPDGCVLKEVSSPGVFVIFGGAQSHV